MKILKLFIVLIFTVPVLSGCYDYKEPNDIAYIVAVGIDKAENENVYNYSLQYVRPTQITGGASQEGGKTEDTSDIISIEAPSVYSALNVGNHVLSKTLTLSHTKLIVVSDELAKEGIGEIIESMGRNSDIRPNVYFCVSKGEAGKYLKEVKPTIEINPTKYYRLIFENNTSSYIPVGDSQKVYLNYKNKTKQNIIPYVGTAKKESSSSDSEKGGEEEKKSEQSGEEESEEKTQKENNLSVPINDMGFEHNMKEYIAGNMDIERKNKSEAMGACVFRNDKMIATLNGIESEIYNILNGTYKVGYSVISSKNSPNNPVTIRLEQLNNPKIKVKINGEKINISIKINLEGSFVQTPTDYFVEKDIITFEEETKEYIKSACMIFLKRTTGEFNSDILGFSSFARRSFLTYDKYLEYGWEEKYKNAEFDVSVDFGLKRLGLFIRTEESEG